MTKIEAMDEIEIDATQGGGKDSGGKSVPEVVAEYVMGVIAGLLEEFTNGK